VKSLAQRTPNETAYFLKQVLADSSDSGIERRIRGYLEFFPPDAAAGLLKSVKNHASIYKTK